MIERTFSMIKPDAVSRNLIGAILNQYEGAHFTIVALQMRTLARKEAETFYAVHRARPFYESLISFICSGPVVAMVLEGKDAVLSLRRLIGATDPKQAEVGTVRANFGTGIEANAVHASDSIEAASFEIPLFFSEIG